MLIMQKVSQENKISNLNPFSKGQILKLQTESPLYLKFTHLRTVALQKFTGINYNSLVP